MEKQYSLDDLIYLMSRLRSPEDGCPWDRKQTFESIVPHTIEEAYEVADAIKQQDYSHVKEELGDLLFQVIFYSQLGKEQGHFDFYDIVSGIVAKLVRRHPHVFPDGALQSRLPPGTEVTEEEIKANWEKIKEQEAEEKRLLGAIENTAFDSMLDSVSRGLPSLIVAEKLQKKAATVGFDWQEIDPVFDKLEEELGELKEAWKNSRQASCDEKEAERRQAHIEEELGDLLFVCVNLSRFLKVKPDQALSRTNDKFRSRFAYIEQSLAERGLTFDDVSLEDMERLWQKAKSA